MVSRDTGQLVAMRQRTCGRPPVRLSSARRMVQALKAPAPAAAAMTCPPPRSSCRRCMARSWLGRRQGRHCLVSQTIDGPAILRDFVRKKAPRGGGGRTVPFSWCRWACSIPGSGTGRGVSFPRSPTRWCAVPPWPHRSRGCRRGRWRAADPDPVAERSGSCGSRCPGGIR